MKLNYTIRTMSAADIPAVVDFYNALEAVEPANENQTVDEFTQIYNEPGAQDSTRFIAHLSNDDDSEGQIIGYGMVEKNDDSQAAWSGINVLPAYRQQGVGTALYRHMLQALREKGVTEWRCSPHQSYNLAIAFWQQHGFTFDRYGWQMQLGADVEVPQPQVPEGFSLRHFVPGQDEENLWRVSNESFAQHHWYTPHSLEERVYWTKQPGFAPEDIFFACTSDGQVVGYCWTGISEEEIKRRALSVGWIHDLGVIPVYQGHGLGRALLLSGVHYLRQRVTVVELGVEGLNAKALPLYESVGFHPINGYLSMERKLDWSTDEQ